MATVNITDDNFREIYQKNDILILDFWASWCAPCKQFAPTFETVSNNNTETVFGKIETEDQQKLSEYFQIRSIPTIVIIREQIEVYRNSGVLGPKDLQIILDKVKELDMDIVKKKMDEEESQD